MSTILAIDTTTNACSIALARSGEITESFRLAPREQSHFLMGMIESLLQQEACDRSTIDAVAVSHGPGSFMGVRLGVGIAQGIAYGLSIPIIPCSSLQVLAQTAFDQHHVTSVISAWDARMKALYWGGYDIDQHGIMQNTVTDSLTLVSEFILDAPEPAVLVGNAWQVYVDDLSCDTNLTSHQSITDIYPRAASLAKIAEHYYLNNHSLTTAELIEPVYLRDKVTY